MLCALTEELLRMGGGRGVLLIVSAYLLQGKFTHPQVKEWVKILTEERSHLTNSN